MSNSNYYTQDELSTLGICSFGKNVLISRKASLYGAQEMVFGDHVRIDDFVILSGKISIASYIHVAAFCGLFAGTAGIEMQSFSGLSSGCRIYAQSDDYSGLSLTNPTVPEEYRSVSRRLVFLGKHAIVGSGSIMLPGAKMEDGAALGSMSLLTKTAKAWGIYFGIPAVRIKERKKDILIMEQRLMKKFR